MKSIPLIDNSKGIKPDVVFLDIKMSKEYGYRILELGDLDYEEIFVTTYDNYAIKAIRFS